MTATPLTFAGDARRCTATTTASRWLESVTLWWPRGEDTLTTGDVETLVVLQAGTFDLVANGTAWPARGARTTPFDGRPMAVFLPPRCEFRVRAPDDGSGRILLVSARQPGAAPAPEGREGLSRKPLLPLAGSGKAFDPASGEWRMAETFPSSAESLPPRRIQRLPAGVFMVERVFAPDYKALTLSLDEVVVPRGHLRLADVPDRPECDEVLLFVDTECEALVGTETRVTKLHGPGAFTLTPEELVDLSVTAIDGRCYVALAYAGK